jgi:hypothetical protein
MEEASLTFPAICLTLSFLFVIGVYNASITQRLTTFHRCITLPMYLQIEHIVTNGTWANQAAADYNEARYEPINHDINEEAAEHEEPTLPALPCTPRAPLRSLPYRPAKSRSLNIHTPIPANRHASAAEEIPMTVFYAREARSNELESSSSRSEVSYDEYDTGSSDSDNIAWDLGVLDPHIPGDQIPVWELEAEREIYTVHERHPRGIEALLDRTIEWTAQMVFALVAPEIVEEQA